MIKLRLGDLDNAKPVLSKILTCDLPFASARLLGQMIKKVDEELTLLNQKRIELVKKYGAEDEKTKAFTVTPDNMEAFMKDYGEIFQTEIDFDATPIPVGILERPNIILTTEEYLRLDKLLG